MSTDEPRDPYEPAADREENSDYEPGEIEMEARLGRVIFQFDQKVKAVVMTPDEAQDFAGSLLNLSRRARSQDSSSIISENGDTG